MTATQMVAYVVLGLAAGTLGGLIGIGGGIIMIPAMVYFFAMSQHTAQGTSLAVMLPPVGLLAVLEYYRRGSADLHVAAFICIGFFIGGYFGARIANSISTYALQKVFAVALLLISVRMLLKK